MKKVYFINILMKLNFKFIYWILNAFTLFFIVTSYSYKTLAENFENINLDYELSKGNLLIGIKQYLKKQNKESSNTGSLDFNSKNTFINLSSANGIQHKSNNFKIIFKEIPLKDPYIIERLVYGPFSSFESAKHASKLFEKNGLNPVIANPKDWELWLPIDKKDQINKNFKLKKISIKKLTIPYLVNAFTYQKLDGPISINSFEDFKINNINFGKNFFLVRDSYGSWTLIQKISFEKYLKGVIPHEIGSNSPIEALKAQAVIARTWAFYNSNRFRVDKFHLCVTTQCQVYKPSKKYKNIDDAIISTKNQILVFNNKPINAFYHASNGGITAKASESWSLNDYPYLISKYDLRKSVKIKISKFKRNELKQFLKYDNDIFFGNKHYLFRWERMVSNDRIQDLLLRNNLILQNMKIKSLNVVERGPSGRVTKLKVNFKNSNEVIYLVKDEIRKFLKFLPSNLFFIDNLNNNFSQFKGGGFGHGVGLSQSGAIDMAKSGYSYKKILKHYYKQTEIQNIMDLKK